MEPSPATELFSLTIDPLTKAHLMESAKWARFLAIVGFVFLIIMLFAGIGMSVYMTSAFRNADGFGQGSGMMATLGAGSMAIGYMLIAIIAFFPLLFLFRFATRMKTALTSNDQQALNSSFLNLKTYLRFLGIITIIVLALYALMIVLGIVGAAAFS